MRITALLVCFLFTAGVYGQNQDSDSTIVALEKVVAEFTTAIAEKDSISFMELFFTPNVSFTGMMTKKTEWSIKKNYAEFQGLSVSTAQKFISEICSSESAQHEEIRNLSMEYDGPVAQIEFDYIFHSDDKIFQWGHERWNLVYVEEAWLITDVIYSVKFPKVEPVPEPDN